MRKYFKNLDVILTILVVIDILLIMASVLFNLSPEYTKFVLLFDIMLCIVLIVNFILAFRQSKDKKTFFKRNWLDLFASLPFELLILPFISNVLYAYPIIILVRILRFLLLIKVLSRFTERFLDATYLDKIMAAFIVVVLGSIFTLYYFDPNVTSLFSAVWFVFQTITTVGYGDVIPSSPIGHFVGVVLLVVGVLMFSIFTASFAYIFNDKIFKEENVEFNQKVNGIKDNLNETRSSIDEIREKSISNEKGLEKINERLDNLEENTKKLSEHVDYLIEIIEKR